MSISLLTDFASNLSQPALSILSQGYIELVNNLRADEDLQQLVINQGIDTVIKGNHTAIKNLQKENRELVTTAEKKAEEVMRQLVLATYPTHAIVGEELGEIEGSEYLWVFDPVDGTSAMIRTAIAEAYQTSISSPIPAFGISIAVIHQNQAIIGVVGELRPDESGLVMPNLWVGSRNQPTIRNGEAVRIDTPISIDEAVLACTVPDVMFSQKETWSGFQALSNSTARLVIDQNCIGFMNLLDGGIHIVIERDLTLPDAAALVPILLGAGISVTDHKGQPIAFDERAQKEEYCILAANPDLHPMALSKVLQGVPETENRYRAKDVHHGYVIKFSVQGES